MAIPPSPEKEKGEGRSHLASFGYTGEVFLGDLFLNITGVLIVALGVTLVAVKAQNYERTITAKAPLSFLACRTYVEARLTGEKIDPSSLLDSRFAEDLFGRNFQSKEPVIFLGEGGANAAFFLSTYLGRRGFSEARLVEGQCPLHTASTVQ